VAHASTMDSFWWCDTFGGLTMNEILDGPFSNIILFSELKHNFTNETYS
jgi:hypothetical protein